MTLTRRMRRRLRGPVLLPSRAVFQRQSEAYRDARVIVRCYYAALLFLAVWLMPEWPGHLARRDVMPLWPVAWLTRVDLRTGIAVILAGYVGGALLGALFPDRRWARAAAFLGLFEFVAYNNSLGKIGHSLHAWVLTSFLLVFLPGDRNRPSSPARVVRQRFLIVFGACQAMVLLTYTMSGLGKVGRAVAQLCLGETSAFHPHALAVVVADRLLQTNSQSLLGPWLIDHPLAGWPFLLATLYLQLVAFFVAFRPALHRWWGIGLVLMHLGTVLLLTVHFPQNILLLALLLFFSPFRRDDVSWRERLRQLPLFGRLFRFTTAARQPHIASCES